MSLSARAAGGEARRGGSCLDAKNAHNLSPDTFGILNGFARAEANHPPTRLLHEIRSARIRFALTGVMLAVDFNDQLPCDAGKVCKIEADRMLTSELQPAHAMRSQEFPDCLLGAAIGQAQFPRPLGSFLGSHPPLLASPPAARAERDMICGVHQIAITTPSWPGSAPPSRPSSWMRMAWTAAKPKP